MTLWDIMYDIAYSSAILLFLLPFTEMTVGGEVTAVNEPFGSWGREPPSM